MSETADSGSSGFAARSTAGRGVSDAAAVFPGALTERGRDARARARRERTTTNFLLGSFARVTSTADPNEPFPSSLTRRYLSMAIAIRAAARRRGAAGAIRDKTAGRGAEQASWRDRGRLPRRRRSRADVSARNRLSRVHAVGGRAGDTRAASARATSTTRHPPTRSVDFFLLCAVTLGVFPCDPNARCFVVTFSYVLFLV